MAFDMITRRSALTGGAATIAVSALPVRLRAQAPSSPIDAIVQPFLQASDAPGVSIAIVRPDAPPITRGYGVRRLGDPAKVDADTLFAIASNSKSFLAASLGMLVEEGKLAWDAPVVKYMPDFRMSEDSATQMTTVRDLLCHRSGLPLGAGDLMQFPLSDHTRADILHGLRYLPLARGFRSGYAYDNILYVVAGMLVERVSNMPWESFLTRRLLQPLGMRTAVATRELVRTDNIAARHARLGPPARGLGPIEVVAADESLAGSPAGGINASANDIVAWLSTQLGHGVTPGGQRLWSEATQKEMWTPQIITASTAGPSADAPTRGVMSGYALGWGIGDYRGHRLISHSGGLSGQITQTAMLPEQGIGVAVFTNTEDGVSAQIRNALLDHLLAAPPYDWLSAWKRAQARNETQIRELAGTGDFPAPAGGPSLPLKSYVGRYRDPWYGDIAILERDGRLAIDFTRTPVFKSALEPFGPDAFSHPLRQGRGRGCGGVLRHRKGRPHAAEAARALPQRGFQLRLPRSRSGAREGVAISARTRRSYRCDRR
jgi:CubicO group peptidase (beta-lactamase class C family)